jgi:hypothetical protein
MFDDAAKFLQNIFIENPELAKIKNQNSKVEIQNVLRVFEF